MIIYIKNLNKNMYHDTVIRRHMRHIVLLVVTFMVTLSARPLDSLQGTEIYKDQNISGWVTNEKVNGISGYCDGETRCIEIRGIFRSNQYTDSIHSYATKVQMRGLKYTFEGQKVIRHHS